MLTFLSALNREDLAISLAKRSGEIGPLWSAPELTALS